MDQKVVILGSRGSIPVNGSEYLTYGGATNSIFVQLCGRSIVLDAGTGILSLPRFLRENTSEIDLLLSHGHLDHLLGLPMCPLSFRKDITIRIFGKESEAWVRRLMSPPLWPVGPEDLPAQIRFFPMEEQFHLEEVQVSTLEGIHPGGITAIRLDGAGTRIVYITDCTLTPELVPHLTQFAFDCDVLLCGGPYSPQQWAGKEHFGHSTWLDAARLGAVCQAKLVRIIHHSPDNTDDLLDRAAHDLTAIHPNCAFARAGEELPL